MQSELILRNKKIYDSIAPLYERQHIEIFNQTEQERIHRKLEWVLSQIGGTPTPPLVLDFGSGTGNLTRHLLALGANVVAADISGGCLSHLVDSMDWKERLDTLLLSGSGLEDVETGSYDVVAAYSVLHHIPNYLASIRELVRVLKPGGLIFLDHENYPGYWEGNEEYALYCEELTTQEVERPEGIVARFRRVFLKKGGIKHIKAAWWSLRNSSMGEGDIHVYPDDHIDWEAIRKCLDPYCHVLKEEDYLVCRERQTPAPVWNKWNSRCVDMRLLVAKKNSLENL